MFKNKVIINIRGKNIINFLKRLNNYKIELLDIKYNDNNNIDIKIYKCDLQKVMDIKTTYEVEEKGYLGFIKIVKKININKYIIIFILLGLSVVIFLSKIIFYIDVITNDNRMKNKILDELNNNGVKIFRFKKNYNELQIIKKKILEKYKNEIDWIEIENVGTKYIVRYEPRLNNPINSEDKYRHIIALKNAIIYSLDIKSGQIIKNRNDYVKKGDIIVSGYISLNDSIKDTVSSNGLVYGEVWYEVTVTYPLKYKEEIITGKDKNVYVFKFLNKNIELFNFKRYKYKKIKSSVLLKNNILPLSLEKQYQQELKIKCEDNTVEEATLKAVDVATKKIEDNLSEKEFIKNKKILGSYNDNTSVTVKIFYSVIEDITDYQEIEEYNEFINDSN